MLSELIWSNYPYSTGLHHRHWGYRNLAPIPAKLLQSEQKRELYAYIFGMDRACRYLFIT